MPGGTAGLRFSWIIRRRLFAGGDRARSLGQRHRTRAVGGTGADISPANFSIAVNNVGDRGGDESSPMALVFRADGADQFGIGIDEQTERIGIELDMRAVFLAVTRHAVEEPFPFFRRLDADAENLHFPIDVSFGFVNEGRHLGPAPGSPAAAVEKDDRGRSLSESRGKFNGRATGILQLRRRELIADF